MDCIRNGVSCFWNDCDEEAVVMLPGIEAVRSGFLFQAGFKRALGG